MLIAKEKAKKSIGEYFIYMFQIEDLLRACEFNKDLIDSNIISQYEVDDTQKQDIEDWYMGLVELMETEKITEKGHLTFLTNKMNEVFDFHLYLLQNKDQTAYQQLYKETEAELVDFASKHNSKSNAVVLIANAIYAYYLLRLKKETISKETSEAVAKFSKLFALLSQKFSEYESGKLSVLED